MSLAPSLPSTPAERRVGAVLQALVLTAGLWVVLLSAVCAGLSWMGHWRPSVVGPVAVVLAVFAMWMARRVVAVSVQVWSACALLIVCVAAGVWLAATHAEQVLVRRDSASNLQAAISLATTAQRDVPIDEGAYGGQAVISDPDVTLASPAFYEVQSARGPVIQPQFVIGPAATYSIGVWAGGASGAMVLPAVLTAVGLLGVGLITARCVGPRWAAPAAAGTALLYPLVHVGRTTYSEPLAMLTLTAGLLALVSAATSGDQDQRAAVLAGVLIGGTAFVRIDGLRETILLIPYLALVLASRAQWAVRVAAAAAITTALALLAALGQANQYLGSIAGSLVPLVALGVLLTAMVWAALTWRGRGPRLPRLLSRRLPGLLAGLTLLVGCYLATRPLWQVVRQPPNTPVGRYVAGMQARQGLPVDGGRTYAEDSVTWLSWYVGPVALVVALVVLAAAFARAGAAWRDRQPLPPWTGVLIVAAGSSLLMLYRPGITPDHPWATRRLLIVLPFVVVLVVTAAAWASRRLVRRRPMAVAVAAVALLLGSLVIPTALATWPHASERVEAGSLAAVDRVCAAFTPGQVALMVDSRAANEWPQVLRGECDVPAISATAAARRDPTRLQTLVRRLSRVLAGQGKQLVVVGADSATSMSDLGLIPQEAVSAMVLEQDHRLDEPAGALVALPIAVWLGRPTS